MFHRKAFQLALVAADTTCEDVAKAIGINTSTLYRKINGQSEFTRAEIQKICEVLHLDSPMDIFFTNELA